MTSKFNLASLSRFASSIMMIMLSAAPILFPPYFPMENGNNISKVTRGKTIKDPPPHAYHEEKKITGAHRTFRVGRGTPILLEDIGTWKKLLPFPVAKKKRKKERNFPKLPWESFCDPRAAITETGPEGGPFLNAEL